jgi:hypothetical protein
MSNSKNGITVNKTDITNWNSETHVICSSTTIQSLRQLVFDIWSEQGKYCPSLGRQWTKYSGMFPSLEKNPWGVEN